MEAATAMKEDEESSRTSRRLALRKINSNFPTGSAKSLDSALKKHTALIRRMKQSLATDNRDQILNDIDSLTLEKHIDEIANAASEGVSRCKTDKDIWSAVEIISALHRRFPSSFTPSTINLLLAGLAPPSRSLGNTLPPELKEKEDANRISRQRPILRVCAELAMVNVICDRPGRSGGEWIMKVIRDLLSNDSTFSSLPLLSTFLKAYARPFLGTSIGHPPSSKEDWASEEERLSTSMLDTIEADSLVEKDVRDRFKKMCEGYFEKVTKRLVVEFERLQDQDRRNHEAYIRSGEIFEDRQQAYEKMTKNYEKLLVGCQSLSELLHMQMPVLRTAPQQQASIGVSSNPSNIVGAGEDDMGYLTGPWEDEEEKKFYEGLIDLADFVPKSALGMQDIGSEPTKQEESNKEVSVSRREEEATMIDELQKELAGLSTSEQSRERHDPSSPLLPSELKEAVPTPVSITPIRPSTPTASSNVAAPAGPSQLVTALILRLSDATNRTLIDEAAVQFAFLNSKAARKRLVKFLSQLPRNRQDLVPYYARLVATLNKYMPDIGEELVSILEEEFRYLNRKRTVKELTERRMKNIAFVSALTKFRIVPSHSVLHMFKVYLDDFTGINVENVALMLEGCGRFLLRSEDTRDRMATMLELMKRKQSLQHFDQRQLLLLENAYYQCNPPERVPREEKQKSSTELFIRHLLHDVLAKKNIDKISRLTRKLDWCDVHVVRLLHKYFTKPWKIRYGNISLYAMLVYDLQRYHPEFVIGIVDQVLEDTRRGLEHNIYNNNQRRVAIVKYLGELYIYRVIGSSIIFETLWSLATFGHNEGRPLPGQFCPVDAADDFFRIRLICILLDTCGMCFDRGAQKRKLDSFVVFFQSYVLSKEPMPMDIEYMYLDSLEALRPKLELFKTFEQAASAVDELFNIINRGIESGGEDAASGEESDEDRRAGGEEEETLQDNDEDDERPVTPDAHVVRTSSEDLAPSAEADADFAKELAKMITETSSESRKVDRRTALAMWDLSMAPSGIKKRRPDDNDESTDAEQNGISGIMKFTVVTRRGPKHQTRELSVPSTSAIAVHTRTAQLQDKAEQEHLKRFVLDYEQREEEASRQSNGHRIRDGG